MKTTLPLWARDSTTAQQLLPFDTFDTDSYWISYMVLDTLLNFIQVYYALSLVYTPSVSLSLISH